METESQNLQTVAIKPVLVNQGHSWSSTNLSAEKSTTATERKKEVVLRRGGAVVGLDKKQRKQHNRKSGYDPYCTGKRPVMLLDFVT